MSREVEDHRHTTSSTKTARWEPSLPTLYTKRKTESLKSTNNDDMVLLPNIYLIGNSIGNMENIKKREVQEK